MTEKTMAQEPKTITLPVSGWEATIHPSKAKHIMAAQRLVDGDTSKFMAALAAVLIEFNGKYITIEEIEEMPGPDFMELQIHLSESNFISPQKTLPSSSVPTSGTKTK